MKLHFPFPFPIIQCVKTLNARALKEDIFQASRSPKYLRAHYLNRGYVSSDGLHSTKIPRRNMKWKLYCNHSQTTKKKLKALWDANNSLNWLIYNFVDCKKNAKYLNVQYSGDGGCTQLAQNLAEMKTVCYALLAFEYGQIAQLKRRLIILVIWHPPQKKIMEDEEKKFAQSSNNNIHTINLRSNLHKNKIGTVFFFQYKQMIKEYSQAKKEMNVDLHSQLTESFILSDLYRAGLVDDIILRVSKIRRSGKTAPMKSFLFDENVSNGCGSGKQIISPMVVIHVPREWTLEQLKRQLAKNYKMNIKKIQIILVPNLVKKRNKTFRIAQTNHFIQLTEDKKKLHELKIDHGSQIYIHDYEDSRSPKFINANIKRDRLKLWENLFKTHHRNDSPPKKHRQRQLSMPSLDAFHLQEEPSLTNNTDDICNGALSMPSNVQLIQPQSANGSPDGAGRSWRDLRHSMFTVRSPKPRYMVRLKKPSHSEHTHPYFQNYSSSPNPSYVQNNNNYKKSKSKKTEEKVPPHKKVMSQPLSHVQSSLAQSESSLTELPINSNSHSSIDTGADDGIPIPPPLYARTTPISDLETVENVSDIELAGIMDYRPMSAPVINTAPIPKIIPMSVAFAPLPAPCPLATIKSSSPVAAAVDIEIPLPPMPIPPSIANIKHKRLKSYLDELIEIKDEEVIEDNTNFSLLQPYPCFTIFDSKIAREISKQALNETTLYSTTSDIYHHTSYSTVLSSHQSLPITNQSSQRPPTNTNMYTNSSFEEEYDTDTNNNGIKNTSNAHELIPLPYTEVSVLMPNQQPIDNIDLNDLFITNYNIGRGKTATVHQALYKNQVFVALKQFIFQKLSASILADFHSEANTLKNLRHPNIVMLVGSHLDKVSGELYLVLEWLPGGCLYDVLHDKNVVIEFRDILMMAIDIARGMEYLHMKNLIHRDLKTHNLLLDEEYRVKVTDFGTAKHLQKMTANFTEVGTLGYVAPEVLDPPLNGYDGKVDVFSYGVILWEMFARFEGDNVLTSVSTLKYASQLKKGFRPQIPSDTPVEFCKLIRGCWEFHPQKRPTFSQIVLYLEALAKKNRSMYELLFLNVPIIMDEDDDEFFDEEDSDGVLYTDELYTDTDNNTTDGNRVYYEDDEYFDGDIHDDEGYSG